MRVFFDTSALVKRYINEDGSDLVENICGQASQVIVSGLCFSEVFSAVNQRRRQKLMGEKGYRLIKATVIDEFKSFIVCPFDEKTLYLSVDLIEQYPLRTLDAIHLAAAIQMKPKLFVSADRQQLKVAKALKLTVQDVNA